MSGSHPQIFNAKDSRNSIFDQIDESSMTPHQRDLVSKDRLQIQYHKFKIAKMTQDRARVAQTELGIYGTEDEPTSASKVLSLRESLQK